VSDLEIAFEMILKQALVLDSQQVSKSLIGLSTIALKT